jgi:hypothetical protein
MEGRTAGQESKRDIDRCNIALPLEKPTSSSLRDVLETIDVEFDRNLRNPPAVEQDNYAD